MANFARVNCDSLINLDHVVSIDISTNELGRQCLIKMINGEVFMIDNELRIRNIERRILLQGG